jgi:hypothetical protein
MCIRGREVGSPLERVRMRVVLQETLLRIYRRDFRGAHATAKQFALAQVARKEISRARSGGAILASLAALHALSNVADLLQRRASNSLKHTEQAGSIRTQRQDQTLQDRQVAKPLVVGRDQMEGGWDEISSMPRPWTRWRN